MGFFIQYEGDLFALPAAALPLTRALRAQARAHPGAWAHTRAREARNARNAPTVQ
jgi:hypothetical protein